ncbi:hypothetical protein D9619_011237 [Psilocybe cf. subviscida]|uniref:DUF6533 domain-containing protein n=1 Tax=Psilocybe cf. subviscida TaxID=2480587 RepID=A0A8H5BJI9_9AGAR|nr:hypothetical protein D9619_011237 [Psilocybe cf. subviscida]
MASQIGALFSTIELFQKENYSLVAATTVLAYDILSTFPDEVQHIWKAKWSLPKGLYILARYYGLVYLSVKISINLRYNVPLHVLGYYWFWILFGDILFVTFVNMLFSLRMYALYGKNKRVLAFFIILCVAEYGTEFYISFLTAQGAARTAFLPPPGVPLPGCLETPPPLRSTLIAWIPNLIVNSVFFFASLPKLVNWSDDRDVLMKSNTNHGQTLLTVCLRDGTLFYLLEIGAVRTMSSVIVNMATSLTRGGQWNPLTYPWLITAYSFSGTHIIMNLRKAAAKGANGINSTATVSGSSNIGSMRFQQNETPHFPRRPCTTFDATFVRGDARRSLSSRQMTTQV